MPKQAIEVLTFAQYDSASLSDQKLSALLPDAGKHAHFNLAITVASPSGTEPYKA